MKRADNDGRHRRRTSGRAARSLLAAIAIVALMTACGDDDSGATDQNGEAGTQAVTLMLPFSESVSFFSPLLADELGYFEEEGLAVEVSPSDGGSVALQQVVSGNQDLALVSPALILTAVAEGNAVVVPYTDKHRNLFSVVVPVDSEIASPEDLEGRVLGITDFGGGELPLARAMLARAGLEEDVDVELLVVGEGGPAVAAAFEDGTIDAYAASWSDFFPLVVGGLELEEILQPELSELPSEVLVATPDYVGEHADVIEGVSRAMAKASYFTTHDNDAALNLLRERVPQEHEDSEAARAALDLWLGIADVPEVDGEARYGAHDPDTWETLKEVLSETAEVDDVEISAILDDGFIDAANDFDRAEVEAHADELNLSYP
ncbi:MAG: ABC transporter substrate-binding protein [Acidimicrobiales bacterium]